MSKPLKVLHLVTWLAAGGIERWLLASLKGTDRNQIIMDFCCKGPNTGELAYQALALGAKVYHCPLRPSHWGYVKGLSRILQTEGYDLVHNHLQTYSGIGTYVPRRMGVPVITGFHNTAFPSQSLPAFPFQRHLHKLYQYLSIKYAIKHSDLITGCSQAVIDNLSRNYGAPPEKCQVIYYGVEVPEPVTLADRQALRHELGLPQDRLLITHIGRFLPQKNHRGLVEIAARVVARDPRAHFLLVGEGPLRPEIERLVQEKNLGRHFSFLGLRHDVERILSCSDIFILPSIWEGLGLVILEAMAAGLPVVASDLPATRELVAAAETGYLVPSRSEQEMADAIVGLMSDKAQSQAMGTRAKDIVLKRYSISSSINKLLSVYKFCINNKKLY